VIGAAVVAATGAGVAAGVIGKVPATSVKP